VTSGKATTTTDTLAAENSADSTILLFWEYDRPNRNNGGWRFVGSRRFTLEMISSHGNGILTGKHFPLANPQYSLFSWLIAYTTNPSYD